MTEFKAGQTVRITHPAGVDAEATICQSQFSGVCIKCALPMFDGWTTGWMEGNGYTVTVVPEPVPEEPPVGSVISLNGYHAAEVATHWPGGWIMVGDTERYTWRDVLEAAKDGFTLLTPAGK